MMRRHSFTFVLALLLVAARAGTADDRAKLQGRWRETSHISSGHEDLEKDHVITISGDTLTESHTILSAGEFKVGSDQGLQTIDMTYVGGPQDKTTRLGVYLIKDNTCTICYALRGDRPNALSPKAGVLEVWERVGAPKDGQARLEGKWKTVRWVFAGKDRNAADFSGRIISFEGNRFEIRRDYDSRLILTLAEETDPRSIDLTHPRGARAQAGRVHKGIYKLENDVLTLCYTPLFGDNPERPTKFESTPEGRLILCVFTREK
jgi:uncharacterized protein (TIGR03067 family)